ncbi:VOC family protein [Rhodococcus sp. NPDC059968]|uniref:VOC family protein n=1 Tax=Rhodococcus sp. NPDC059968 TaxID=3347017 RepID=UPI00367222B1
MSHSDAPPTTGIHHFSPTVSDVEASDDWYSRVFGLERLPTVAPHHGDEEGGYAVLLIDPRTGFLIGLHHHTAVVAGSFDERRVGLDHIAWGVPQRSDLDAWAAWLSELGVPHSGVIDKDSARPYSVVVFRDPDNIQLELFHRS